MKGQRLRTSVAPSSALALAPVLASFAHAVAFFCHRSVVDRDTTKGGATPPLGTTDPSPSSLAHASARWGRSPLSRLTLSPPLADVLAREVNTQEVDTEKESRHAAD
jgi:hypothetical protein